MNEAAVKPTTKRRKHRYVREALQLFRRNYGSLLPVIIIVGLPTAIIGSLSAADPTFAAYSSLATLLMNVAVVWTVVQLEAGYKVTLKRAYYEGTASFVRFLLVALVLAAQLLPLALGFFIYLLGTTGVDAVVTAPERALLLVVAIVLALPTLYWLTRYVFSPYVVVGEGVSPIAALRRSKAITKGKFWLVARQLVILLVIISVAVFIPSVIIAFLRGSAGQLAMTVLQFAVMLVLLPFLNLYLYNLYKALE